MKKRILIVDDDQDILEPLSMILEEGGYVVSTTPKGEMTHIKVNEFKPNLLLLDLLLSGSDGRKICKSLKTDNQMKHMPIIMMSAHPSAYTDSQDCGADGFIAKPFESEDLLNLIKKKLR